MDKRNEQALEELTASILQSYRGESRIERIGHRFLPSRERIVEILNHLRALLFPGYFGLRTLTEENAPFHVGSLLARLDTELTEQIQACIGSAANSTEPGYESPAEDGREARRMARAFFARVPAVRERLNLDAQAAYDGDPAARSIDEIIYCYPGFYAVVVYRLAHELHELGVPLMPRIMTEHAHGLTGADIHPGAQIGRSFFIDHATGVVIGETTEIGENVKIYQGVTLGAKSFPKDQRGRVIKGLKRHPTISDRVTILANATILGGDTVIGEGVTVAGNTFVDHSVPARHLVAQEPPELRVLDKDRRG